MNLDQIINQVANQHPYKKIDDRSSYSPYNEGWSDACDILGERIKKHLKSFECEHIYRLATKKEIKERKIESQGIGIWICEKCDIIHHSM